MVTRSGTARRDKLWLLICAFLVLLVSFFTYFRNYWQPDGLFWDENYHVATAHKYLDSKMYLHEHPPLGRMFIALGEGIFRPNEGLDTSHLSSRDYVKKVPAGFSFVGVRFFPVLFATLSAVLVFFILYKISKHRFIALAFTSLYLFENALIVHSRGAMLDGIQIFFVLAAILYWLLAGDDKAQKKRHFIILGLLVGAALSIKLSAATILLILLPLFLLKQRYTGLRSYLFSFLRKGGLFLAGVMFIFLGSYYVHSLVGQKGGDKTYYQASAKLQKIVDNHQLANPINLPVVVLDNLAYAKEYNAKVPKYNPNKPGENGSLYYTWPVGNKSINYRWERDGDKVSYLYLQGNPLIWLVGLIGLFYSLAIVLTVVIFKRPILNRRLFFIICSLLGLYITYMASMALLERVRVMYLYHYFIPLLLSLLLFFSAYIYKFEAAIKRKDRRLFIATALLILLVVASFWLFSPLTYFEPLTRSEFMMRNWFTFWHLKPI